GRSSTSRFPQLISARSCRRRQASRKSSVVARGRSSSLIVYGINPVLEALKSGRVDTIRVSHRADARLNAILDAATRAGVAIRRVESTELDHASHGGVHQGVVALVREQKSLGPEDLVSGAPGPPLIVVLDGIEDPHN